MSNVYDRILITNLAYFSAGGFGTFVFCKFWTWFMIGLFSFNPVNDFQILMVYLIIGLGIGLFFDSKRAIVEMNAFWISVRAFLFFVFTFWFGYVFHLLIG